MSTSDAVVAERRDASPSAATGDELNGARYDGFPTETLAPQVRAFVEQSAATLPVAPDLVALPVLVSLAAAIGNARRIQLKEGWTEPASLYAAIVAETGSMKSPALEAALQPIFAAQVPGKKRTWTSDTTVEQLGVLLEENPRGMLLYRDELTGWVSALNQYKKGKGSDRQFYLSAWSGTSSTVDRKGTHMIMVPKPFLSVVGAIPPSLLHQLDERAGGEDGFIQRLLFAFPEPVPVKWSDTEVSPMVKKAYVDLVDRLLNMEWQGGLPSPLSLTSAAKTVFGPWVDDLYKEIESPALWPPLRGFYAKLKGYCARLALIHALTNNPEVEQVGEKSIAAAAAQVDYFKAQAAKVARRFVGMSVEQHKFQQCVEGIKRVVTKWGELDKRETFRKLNFPAEIFNPAWEYLTRPQLGIGSSKTKFRLSMFSQNDGGREGVVSLTGTDIPTTDTAAIGIGSKG